MMMTLKACIEKNPSGRAEESKRAVSLKVRGRGRPAMKGQAMIEFAIVAPIFFFLIFAAMDYSRMFFSQMTLQDAVQEAGRYASTWNHQPDPNNPGQNLSRVNSIIAMASQYA